MWMTHPSLKNDSKHQNIIVLLPLIYLVFALYSVHGGTLSIFDSVKNGFGDIQA